MLALVGTVQYSKSIQASFPVHIAVAQLAERSPMIKVRIQSSTVLSIMFEKKKIKPKAKVIAKSQNKSQIGQIKNIF